MAFTYTTINGERVETSVARAFAALAVEFRRVWGLDLYVSSGTRTTAEQQYLYNGWINRLPGFNLAAKPGTSNHEENGPRGPRALDVRDSGGDAGVTVIGSRRSIWLRDNCGRFGFVNAGYNFSPKEAWHIEYQGNLDNGVRRAFEIASGQDNNNPAAVRDTRLDQIVSTLPIVLKIVNTDAAGKPTSDGLAGVQLLLGEDHGYVYPADQGGAVVNVSAPYFNNGVATVGSKIAKTNGEVVTISQENLHILLRDLGFPNPGTIIEQVAVNGGGYFRR